MHEKSDEGLEGGYLPTLQNQREPPGDQPMRARVEHALSQCRHDYPSCRSHWWWLGDCRWAGRGLRDRPTRAQPMAPGCQFKVSTELLNSLQEVIRPMIHLAYLTEKPPRPTLTFAASAYHEATVKWNSSIYAALLVSPPKIANMVQDLDREVDRLTERAMEKSWPRTEFREERRSIGRLAASYLNASRAEIGWPPIPIDSVWAWDESPDDSTASERPGR